MSVLQPQLRQDRLAHRQRPAEFLLATHHSAARLRQLNGGAMALGLGLLQQPQLQQGLHQLDRFRLLQFPQQSECAELIQLQPADLRGARAAEHFGEQILADAATRAGGAAEHHAGGFEDCFVGAAGLGERPPPRGLAAVADAALGRRAIPEVLQDLQLPAVLRARVVDHSIEPLEFGRFAAFQFLEVDAPATRTRDRVAACEWRGPETGPRSRIRAGPSTREPLAATRPARLGPPPPAGAAARRPTRIAARR